MNLKEKLARGDFVITAEMAPPKALTLANILYQGGQGMADG